MHRMYEEFQDYLNEDSLLSEVFSNSTLEQEAEDRGDRIEYDIDFNSEDDAISDIVAIIQEFDIKRQNHLLNAVFERLKYSRKVSIKETKKALKQML